MTLAQGTEQNIKDWYGFYKSINTRNNNNKWLIDIALDYYESVENFEECDRINKLINQIR